MRGDLRIITDLVQPGMRLLDLGCGDGELLAYLRETKQVHGYGLELDAAQITSCIARGVNVIEHDLNDGLARFSDNSFDMVVMTETLQSLRRPDRALQDMLRVAKQCVVTFPNFAHWRCRLQILTRGRMPESKHLPHRWFDTPNIHLCTFTDFESLCASLSLPIVERRVVGDDYSTGWMGNLLPNLFGEIAFYRLARANL